jgi:hypothetical protein
VNHAPAGNKKVAGKLKLDIPADALKAASRVF